MFYDIDFFRVTGICKHTKHLHIRKKKQIEIRIAQFLSPKEEVISGTLFPYPLTGGTYSQIWG